MIDLYDFFILTQTVPDDWALNEWRKNGVRAAIVYRSVSKVLRMIRRIWVKCHLPYQHIWYDSKWKNDVLNSKYVIVHLSSLTMTLPRYINKINPDCKVIGWYWNSIVDATLPKEIRGKAELWSFDPEDCKKYGLKFNHQYYFKSLIPDITEVTEETIDVFFCGSDSGRGERIMKLYEIMQGMNLETKFEIVHPVYKGIPDEMKSSPKSYSDILKNDCKTKAILEITRNGQSGATIRELEALFLNKKLITDNKYIVNEDYYDESRIFVLGMNNFEELPRFLSVDAFNCIFYKVDKYDFYTWLNNFLSDVE